MSKKIRMIVEVTCPDWLTAAQARREVRTLINEQCFFGHRNHSLFADGHFELDEIDSLNFRAKAVRPAGKS